MPMQTKWVTYKKYSGFVVRGGPRFDQPVNAALHIDCAVYLAGQLEAACWGTVQGYDGAGMSGGILHNIAVSPKDLSQGSFFTLLARVFAMAPKASASMMSDLAALGWHVSPDGVLRDQAGLRVPGKSIRDEFSGPGGQVPKVGPANAKAKKWAESFHKLFVNPDTWAAQSRYAAEWLAGGNRADELQVYNYYLSLASPKPEALDSVISLPVSLLSPEINLAMCVYHAFSVNAPAIAKQCLSPLLPRLSKMTSRQFAAALISSLGKKKFANWTDSPGDGSNRYDRTRKAVWARPDLWDATLAKALMPKDL